MVSEEVRRLTSYGKYWTMSALSTGRGGRFMKLVRVKWYISYIRNKNRVFYDLFTEACINDLPTKKKIVLPVYLSDSVNHLTSMSLCFVYCLFFFFVLFFFCVFCRKKPEVKYQGGRQSGGITGSWEFLRMDFEGFQRVSSVVLQWSQFWTLCFVGVFVRLVSCSDVTIAQSGSVNREMGAGMGGWTRKQKSFSVPKETTLIHTH